MNKSDTIEKIRASMKIAQVSAWRRAQVRFGLMVGCAALLGISLVMAAACFAVGNAPIGAFVLLTSIMPGMYLFGEYKTLKKAHADTVTQMDEMLSSAANGPLAMLLSEDGISFARPQDADDSTPPTRH